MASSGIKVASSGTDAHSFAHYHPLTFAASSSPGYNRRLCRLSLTLIWPGTVRFLCSLEHSKLCFLLHETSSAAKNACRFSVGERGAITSEVGNCWERVVGRSYSAGLLVYHYKIQKLWMKKKRWQKAKAQSCRFPLHRQLRCSRTCSFPHTFRAVRSAIQIAVYRRTCLFWRISDSPYRPYFTRIRHQTHGIISTVPCCRSELQSGSEGTPRTFLRKKSTSHAL